METQPRWSRRQLLRVAFAVGAAGTSLLVSCSGEAEAAAEPATAERETTSRSRLLSSGPAVPWAWLRIDPDGQVTIWVSCTELGQGVYSALPMLVAEDLAADWTCVHVEQTLLDTVRYASQRRGRGPSRMCALTPLRQASAAARLLLLAAAAQIWGVHTTSCRAEKGWVIHDPSERRLRYGQLAGTAALLAPPQLSEIKLKEPRHFYIVGTRIPCLDV